MNLTIQGSFEAYVWLVLWQVALGCLQSGGPAINPNATIETRIGSLQYSLYLIANSLSWMVWGLSAWVGVQHGLIAGVVFAAVGFGANVLTLIELHRLRGYVMPAQIAGFISMPFFALKTLSALGAIKISWP
jgi:hypothetical protein